MCPFWACLKCYRLYPATDDGKAFHTRGPAAEKPPSPKLWCVFAEWHPLRRRANRGGRSVGRKLSVGSYYIRVCPANDLSIRQVSLNSQPSMNRKWVQLPQDWSNMLASPSFDIQRHLYGLCLLHQVVGHAIQQRIIVVKAANSATATCLASVTARYGGYWMCLLHTRY